MPRIRQIHLLMHQLCPRWSSKLRYKWATSRTGHRGTRNMRILIDQAVYDMRNKGNVAMLLALAERLKKRWPVASLEVLTASPHLLQLYHPAAHPVSSDGRHNWARHSPNARPLRAFVPPAMLRWLFEVREALWHRWPALTPGPLHQRLHTRWGQRQAQTTPAANTDAASPLATEGWSNPDIEQALAHADLVIASGGGYLADSDKARALEVLTRLQRAKSLGKPAVMMGQGVGPLTDGELRAKMAEVLPQLDLIGVREERVALPILHALGVGPERIVLTGDDAVESAYAQRQPRLGTAIGVSIRVAYYTEVDAQQLATVRTVLHQAAAQWQATLLGLPISCDGAEADQKMIGRLVAGSPYAENSWRRFDSPSTLMRKVGRCRMVVAGAFHAAVFALAQGIPVVGLVQSLEYANKFYGLVDQFGAGCQVVHLDDPRLADTLAQAMQTAWQQAETLRPPLLAAAARQIERNRAGYEQLYRLLESSPMTLNHPSLLQETL
jgi:polysaccharide pyruvyl transferase WcaK-like protein